MNGSPQRKKAYLDLQDGIERYATCLVMDVATRWNSTAVMPSGAHRLRPYTEKWIKMYPVFQPFWTTDDEWKVVQYILTILEPIQYWTLWMSKRQDFTLHQVLRIYGNMFDHFEAFMKRLRAKTADFKQDLLRALEAATAKLKEYYLKVTPRAGTLLLMATMLDPYQRLSPFKKWDRAEGFSATEAHSFQYQHRLLFLQYFETHYLPPIETQLSGTSDCPQLAPQTTFRTKPRRDQDDSDSEDDTPTSAQQPVGFNDRSLLTGVIAEGTFLRGYPNGIIDRTFGNLERKKYLMAAVEYIDSRRFSHQQGQDEYFGFTAGNLDTLEEENDDPGKITISWFKPTPDGYWAKIAIAPSRGDMKYLQRVEEMARDIFSCVPHGVGVESSFSIARNVVSWKQSRMTAKTLQANMIVRQHLLKEKTYSYRGARRTAQNEDENPKLVMKKLNKLLCYTDYQHFAEAAAEQQQGRNPHEENPGFGFISGDEKDKDKKSWQAFEDEGMKYAELAGKELKRKGAAFKTVFADTQRIRKFSLNRAQSDTEADETELDDGQLDEEHDFRFFTQEGGTDNPLDALELDDDEIIARDNATSVAPDADIARVRRVTFAEPEGSDARSTEVGIRTPRRSTRRRRQSKGISGSESENEPTTRPLPKSRRTVQSLRSTTTPGGDLLSRAVPPSFGPGTGKGAVKGKGIRKAPANATSKGKKRAAPRRNETEGLGFITSGSDEEIPAQAEPPSSPVFDIPTPTRQGARSRASTRIRDKSQAREMEIQNQLAGEAAASSN